MKGKAEVEAFIRRAEELVGKLAESARIGTDSYLDARYWLKSCDTTELFYLTYHDNLALQLQFMLAHPDAAQPALLGFLLTTDLEKHFAPNDSDSGEYGQLTAAVKFATARVLAGLLTGSGWPSDVPNRTDAAFAAIWQMRGAAKMPTREMLKANEFLLNLAFGNYQKIVSTFERELRFSLAKLESAARTLVKECYLLAQIGAGDSDEDGRFGARSCLALLKYDYYLWRVNQERSAQITLLPVVLVSFLHEQITRGSLPTLRDVLASMRPRSVLTEMESIRRE